MVWRAVCRSGGGRVVAVLVVVCACAGSLAPVAGADPWSGPLAVPGVSSVSAFGFTPGGVGVAIVGPDELLRFPADGVFGSPQATGLGSLNGVRMALFGRGRVVLGGARGTSAEIAFGSVGGKFGRPQTVARGASQETTRVVALAANAAGKTAAVVMAGRRPNSMSADQWLVVREPGGSSFRRVVTLVKGLTWPRGDQAVTVNANGDVLAAWDDGSSVRALIVRADGRVGRVQRLGVGAGGGSRISVALDPTRRAVVLWMALGVGEGLDGFGPGTVHVAYAKPGKTFARARQLDSGLPSGERSASATPSLPVNVVLLRDRAQLAWTGYADGRYLVRAADIGASGTVSGQQTLSPPDTDAILLGMSAGPRGGVVVAWFNGLAGWLPSRQPQASTPGFYAAARSATAATFGATEPIEQVPTVTDAYTFTSPPLLATNPISGQTVLLWSLTLPAGQDALHYAIRQPT